MRAENVQQTMQNNLKSWKCMANNAKKIVRDVNVHQTMQTIWELKMYTKQYKTIMTAQNVHQTMHNNSESLKCTPNNAKQ